MAIQKGGTVLITELCLTPNLRGLRGKVVRKPRNGHYIVKFPFDGQLYIFNEREVSEVHQTRTQHINEVNSLRIQNKLK